MNGNLPIMDIGVHAAMKKVMSLFALKKAMMVDTKTISIGVNVAVVNIGSME